MYNNPFMARPLGRGVKNLLIANVAVFVVLALIAPQSPYRPWWPATVFGLSQVGLRHGYAWQPLTYMFLHGGFFHILANMLGLYFLGPEVERMMGSRRFVAFYLVSGVVAGLFWLLISGGQGWPCIGASGAVYAVVCAFAGLLPNRRLTMLPYFVFPVSMTATTLALLVVGGSLLMALVGDGGHVAHTAHLGGALAGYLYGNYLRTGRIGIGGVSRGIGGYGGSYYSAGGGGASGRFFFRDWWNELRAGIRRSRMHISSPPEGPVDWQRVDAILDKVRFHGTGSLTREEKDILDRASRQTRM